jgi:hypothetical protein
LDLLADDSESEVETGMWRRELSTLESTVQEMTEADGDWNYPPLPYPPIACPPTDPLSPPDDGSLTETVLRETIYETRDSPEPESTWNYPPVPYPPLIISANHSSPPEQLTTSTLEGPILLRLNFEEIYRGWDQLPVSHPPLEATSIGYSISSEQTADDVPTEPLDPGMVPPAPRLRPAVFPESVDTTSVGHADDPGDEIPQAEVVGDEDVDEDAQQAAFGRLSSMSLMAAVTASAGGVSPPSRFGQSSEQTNDKICSQRTQNSPL